MFEWYSKHQITNIIKIHNPLEALALTDAGVVVSAAFELALFCWARDMMERMTEAVVKTGLPAIKNANFTQYLPLDGGAANHNVA